MVSHLVVVEISGQSLGCSRDEVVSHLVVVEMSGQSLGCSRDKWSVTWL